MNRLEIDPNRCKACRLCIEVCPRKVLGLAADLNAKGYHPAAALHQEKCTACALCALVCPDGAIAVYKENKLKQAG